jgi:hypothetical protein
VTNPAPLDFEVTEPEPSARVTREKLASFVHAKVDTYGATVDCVLSTRELTSELSVGNLVQGSFWLIGRTVPPT